MLDSKIVVLIVAVLSLISLAAGEDEKPKIAIDPRPDQAIRVRDDALFTCSMEGKQTLWKYETGVDISTDNTSRIFHKSGELHIKSVTLNDTAKFICITTDLAHNISAELKVYEMPSYLTEGMIIVGINCGLILLFIVCGVHSLIQSRKDKKQRKLDTYRSSGPKHEAVLQMEKV